MFKQIGDVMITSKSHIQTIFLCEQLGSFKPLVPCKFLQHGSLLAYSTYWRLKVIDLSRVINMIALGDGSIRYLQTIVKVQGLY